MILRGKSESTPYIPITLFFFGRGLGLSLYFYTKTSGSELFSTILLYHIIVSRSLLNMELIDWIDKLDRKSKDFSIVTSPALILVTGMFCPMQLFTWMWIF